MEPFTRDWMLGLGVDPSQCVSSYEFPYSHMVDKYRGFSWWDYGDKIGIRRRVDASGRYVIVALQNNRIWAYRSGKGVTVLHHRV